MASVYSTLILSPKPSCSIISSAMAADSGFASRQVTFAFGDFIAAINPKIGIGPQPASITSMEFLVDSSFRSFTIRASMKAELLSSSSRHADAFVESRTPC